MILMIYFMGKKKYIYYLVYAASILLVFFIWFKPTPNMMLDHIIIEEYDERVMFYEEKEPQKFWSFVNKSNEMLTLIIGLVNIYFITNHIRTKKKRVELID
jgi:hypothetical protein